MASTKSTIPQSSIPSQPPPPGVGDVQTPAASAPPEITVGTGATNVPEAVLEQRPTEEKGATKDESGALVLNPLREMQVFTIEHREGCRAHPKAKRAENPDEKIEEIRRPAPVEAPQEPLKAEEPEAAQEDDFCLCTATTVLLTDRTKDGEVGTREVVKSIPGSITFLPLEKKRIPAWVLKSTAIQRAVAAKRLRVVTS